MSEISSLYSSKQTIYKKNNGGRSSKKRNGDVKHIVFKDGKPVMTEIIKVAGSFDDIDMKKQGDRKERKRITAKAPGNRQRRSSEEVLVRKKRKLQDRLKKAIQQSQTLWSEKEGIYISYQGSSGFLVKLFDKSEHLTSSDLMT